MSILDRIKKPKNTTTDSSDTKKAAVKSEAKSVKAAQTVVAPTVSISKKNILLKPVITEKASMSGTYQFMVAPDANRVEVAKAFTALYNKVPRKVNILSVRGKSVRFGRLKGKRSNWKKAVVYLKKGETIDLYA